MPLTRSVRGKTPKGFALVVSVWVVVAPDGFGPHALTDFVLEATQVVYQESDALFLHMCIAERGSQSANGSRIVSVKVHGHIPW